MKVGMAGSELEILIESKLRELEECERAGESIKSGNGIDFYIPNGKPTFNMTEEDWEDCERRERAGEKDLWESGHDTYLWTRPVRT